MTQETISLHSDVLTRSNSETQSVAEEEIDLPFTYWNATVQKLTHVKRDESIQPAYKTLVKCLNEVVYDNKLLPDPILLSEV